MISLSCSQNKEPARLTPYSPSSDSLSRRLKSLHLDNYRIDSPSVTRPMVFEDTAFAHGYEHGQAPDFEHILAEFFLSPQDTHIPKPMRSPNTYEVLALGEDLPRRRSEARPLVVVERSPRSRIRGRPRKEPRKENNMYETCDFCVLHPSIPWRVLG